MNQCANPIIQFRGEHVFLSNFYAGGVSMGNRYYKTVEHAFQAAKTLDLNQRQRIANMLTPAEAKRAGRTLTLREDWEQIKDVVMHALVTQKFQASASLKKSLLETGYRHIYEGNDWGDTYWGVDINTGQGQNRLGNILMSVRYPLLVEKYGV